MLKLNLINTIILILILFITSCDDNNSVLVVEENRLLATVDVHSVPNINNIPRYFYNGYIISSEITELQYIVLNMDTVIYGEPLQYYLNDKNGFIRFSNPYDINIYIVPSAKFEIHTGVGTLSGNIVFPDSVRVVSYNKEDTIKINETLILTFDGNADYFLIYYNYSYLNTDSSGFVSENREMYVKDNEAFFDSTLHPLDGYLKINYIESVNGPLPEINSAPNMYGDGKGYLNVKIFQEFRKEFVVGEGFQIE